MEFYKEVERNIIKKYRKELYRPFVKALDKYELIKENISMKAGLMKLKLMENISLKE